MAEKGASRGTALDSSASLMKYVKYKVATGEGSALVSQGSILRVAEDRKKNFAKAQWSEAHFQRHKGLTLHERGLSKATFERAKAKRSREQAKAARAERAKARAKAIEAKYKARWATSLFETDDGKDETAAAAEEAKEEAEGSADVAALAEDKQACHIEEGGAAAPTISSKNKKRRRVGDDGSNKRRRVSSGDDAEEADAVPSMTITAPGAPETDEEALQRSVTIRLFRLSQWVCPALLCSIFDLLEWVLRDQIYLGSSP